MLSIEVLVVAADGEKYKIVSQLNNSNKVIMMTNDQNIRLLFMRNRKTPMIPIAISIELIRIKLREITRPKSPNRIQITPRVRYIFKFLIFLIIKDFALII